MAYNKIGKMYIPSPVLAPLPAVVTEIVVGPVRIKICNRAKCAGQDRRVTTNIMQVQQRIN